MGSYGASAFSAVAGKFASSAVGTIASGAILGGVGSELTGGNFWQGAVIGGFVAGFNHVMHNIDPPNEYLLNKDGSTTKIGDKGGDTTDYLYAPESTGSPKLRLLATADVQNGFATASEGGGTRDFGVNIRLDNRLQSPALYDPSFDIMKDYVIGKGYFKVTGIMLTEMKGLGIVYKPLGNFIAKYIPKLGANKYFRVGISNSRGRQVFRITRGNSKTHLFDYDLGKIPKIKK